MAHQLVAWLVTVVLLTAFTVGGALHDQEEATGQHMRDRLTAYEERFHG